MRQPHRQRTARLLAHLGGVVVLMGLALPFANAQQGLFENLPGSLKTVPTPEPPNLVQFLNSSSNKVSPHARAAAIALGKALFWEQAVGSDGQACASCHFNAGGDSRTKNQVNPGMRAIPLDTVFNPPFSANLQLQASHFPLTRFNIPDDRSSGLVSDTNDVVSSQGVFDNHFNGIGPGVCPLDQTKIGAICDAPGSFDPTGFESIFQDPVTHAQVRNVEPRHTPTTINAIFNYRSFFDGRARNEFNGVNPIGDLDPYARVLLGSNTGLQKVALNGSLRLEDASLMSQAVGPALSDMEMSYRGRSFPDLGKKMLGFPNALPSQLVAPDDSVLGNNSAAGVKSNYPAKGINKTYAQLIQAAFQNKWWSSSMIVTVPGGTDADGTTKLTFSKATKSALAANQYTQMQYNFSLFWGIAIQMYEATLRADNTPFDQAFDSGNPLTFSSPQWGDKEKQGWNVFQGAGKCIECHGGPELTNNSVRNVRLFDGRIERMKMGDLGTALYDVGFYNTAVRKCAGDTHGNVTGVCDDGAIGTTIGPLSLPLSLARFYQLLAVSDPSVKVVCDNQPTACLAPTVGGVSASPVSPTERIAVVGAFKTPGLRNVELQAPYMHNGGDLTLMDIVNFYDRGGNFPELNVNNLDGSIGTILLCKDLSDTQCSTTGLLFLGLGLSDIEKDSLVAFMKALTDERVRYQRAPFDHPQLFVPNLPADPNCPQCQPGEVPAVGRNGANFPLPTFFDNLAKP